MEIEMLNEILYATESEMLSDPKVFNPPLVRWIQTPIEIRFCGGQSQVRCIQGRVDSKIIARYSQIWICWIVATN